ncbi:TolC family protein [Devosia sp. A369]
MRNEQSIVSLALLAVAAISLAGCATNSTRQVATGCAGLVSQADCSISTYGPVSAAPEVLAADARSSAAASEIERALASGRPDAYFRAGINASTPHIAYEGQPGGAGYSYALGLDVPLYQGGSQAAIVAARADYRASQEVVADRRVATAYEIAISLLRIRQQQQVIGALEHQQGALRTLRQGVDAELAAGAASRVDLDDIDRQLARIKVLRETAKLTVTEASNAVYRLGLSNSSKLPDVAGLGLGENLQALTDLALKNNPRIRQSVAQLDAATSRVSQAQGEMQPSVAAQFEVYGEQIGYSGGGDPAHGARATLQFSMPFDLSGASQAAVKLRADERLAAQFDSEAARNGVAAAVRTAFERRQQARQLRSLAQQEVSSAKAMLQGIEAERQVGERTALDEIRAIENLTAAQINLITAQFELGAAEYTLAAETGLITKLFETSTRAAAL